MSEQPKITNEMILKFSEKLKTYVDGENPEQQELQTIFLDIVYFFGLSVDDKAFYGADGFHAFKAFIEDACVRENQQLKARVARLEESSLLLKNDLLERADEDSDGMKVVDVSNGVWRKFCDALSEAPKQSLAEIHIQGIQRFITESAELINKEPDAYHRVMAREFIEKLRNGVMSNHERLIKILNEQLYIKESDDLNNTATTFDSLGADSLDEIELLMALEEEFDISIHDSEVIGFKCISDVLNYLKAKNIGN